MVYITDVKMFVITIIRDHHESYNGARGVFSKLIWQMSMYLRFLLIFFALCEVQLEGPPWPWIQPRGAKGQTHGCGVRVGFAGRVYS